ncbi:MAG: UDP-N-acetylmuramoyl-L-alanyl-D-glutamate--2,6-diaminopimelate ligase [Bacillota bacterium]
MVLLRRLFEDLTIDWVTGSLDIEVTGLHHDSRKIQPGSLFVCVEGFHTDGHNYIGDAINRGAVAVVVSKAVSALPGITVVRIPEGRTGMAVLAANYYDHPSRKLRMIGVTGTNGKTTTTHLIEQVLRRAGHRVGLIGTIGNKIGGHVLPATHTTPESLELQALLAQMVDAGAGYVVMEVSSHALALSRVDGADYGIGVFTNLTQDHLDFHRDMAEYLEAKGRLFTGIVPDRGVSKYAVVNRDDPYHQYIVQKTSVPLITYGIDHQAQVKALNVQVRSAGVSFTIEYSCGKIDLNLKMTGKFSVYNALAAWIIGWQEGIPPLVIKEALEEATGVAGRFELVNEAQDFSVIVDYAHTPDGLENVLSAARSFVQGRLITVFGCGGDRDRGKRPLMGEVAARLSDYCIITSDNPRTEDPEAIIADIIPGVLRVPGAQYRVVPDRRQAIGEALQIAQKKDLVMIAGKGHETYQIIKDRVLPFDDREVAREFLRSCHHELKD